MLSFWIIAISCMSLATAEDDEEYEKTVNLKHHCVIAVAAKIMFNFWIIAIVCMSLATAEDDGEYGKRAVWKASLCAQNSEALGAALDKCESLDTPEVKVVITKCFTTFLPEAGMNFHAYLTAACEDKSMFRKMEECLEKGDGILKEPFLSEKTKDVDDCYKEVADKYNLEGLPN